MDEMGKDEIIQRECMEKNRDTHTFVHTHTG